MTTEIKSPSAGDVKLAQRKSLDLERADLSALAHAATSLLGELEYFLELPGRSPCATNLPFHQGQ